MSAQSPGPAVDTAPHDAPDPASLGDALRKSETRYRFLAETIPVQVWTARPDGMLDYVSGRAVTEFGIPMARLLLEGWQNVVHPDDLGIAVERWIRSLSSGETYEVEFRLKMTDGTYAWYLARAVAQRGPDGAIVEWLGTNTNIEEQRETQRRMQALLDEVAAQARETEAALEALRADKAALEARVAELEAAAKR
jgi:PAS domain S-box-containing protein